MAPLKSSVLFYILLPVNDFYSEKRSHHHSIQQISLCIIFVVVKPSSLTTAPLPQSALWLRWQWVGRQRSKPGAVVQVRGHPPREQRRGGRVVVRPSPQPPTSQLPWGGGHTQSEEVSIPELTPHLSHDPTGAGQFQLRKGTLNNPSIVVFDWTMRRQSCLELMPEKF